MSKKKRQALKLVISTALLLLAYASASWFLGDLPARSAILPCVILGWFCRSAAVVINEELETPQPA